MKATGIVVEYNPFHNGHVYHATQTKAQTNSDLVIAVMSGDFLQRGEPALIDKWARTSSALENGVDIVFELPYANATAHAPVFASGAIQLLDAALCSSYCFGSENGAIKPFTTTLTKLSNVRSIYNEQIQLAMQRGISYPKAMNEAYASLVRTSEQAEATVDLSLPNNILGFHYMEAAQQMKSSMVPITFPRLGAGYHDAISNDTQIASATGIRKFYFESGTIEGVQQFVPIATYDALTTWLTTRKYFGSWDRFYPLLRYQILRSGPEPLALIADVKEGIENLLYKAAKRADTFQQFMKIVKSKRYTWTRIQRMLVHILTGFTYADRVAMPEPDHLRLLGVTEIGQRYLKENKANMKLPIVSRLANFNSVSTSFAARSSDLYAVGVDPIHPAIGLDYRTPPIRANKPTL